MCPRYAGTPSLEGMHLRTLLRKSIAALLGTSDDAIDSIVKGDTPRLAKLFGVLTSMRHCEELERHAQETVATNNALITCACPSGDEHTGGEQVNNMRRRNEPRSCAIARIDEQPLPAKRQRTEGH